MNAPRYEDGQLGAPLVVVNQVEPHDGEALMPHPIGTTGYRLFAMAQSAYIQHNPTTALTLARWITITERHTLCVGSWNADRANSKAVEVMRQAGDRPVLALGRRVMLAIAGSDHMGGIERAGLYMIPHPARKNRAYLVADTWCHAWATLQRWMDAGGVWS